MVEMLNAKFVHFLTKMKVDFSSAPLPVHMTHNFPYDSTTRNGRENERRFSGE